MELGSVLGDYLKKLGCTAKTLADASGVSAIQFSRWRNGSRRPSAEMLERLAAGIERVSGGAVRKDAALDELLGTMPAPQRSRGEFGRRLDLLLDTLKIHTSEVSRILNFDPS